MHDLANYADIVNGEMENDNRVISMVAEMENGERSFRIRPGLPLGKSYANDIARKYGICFEQVADDLLSRVSASPQ